MNPFGRANRKRRSEGRVFTALGVLLILVCVTFGTVSVWKLTHPRQEAFERQRTEEDLAKEYVRQLLDGSSGSANEPADTSPDAGSRDPVLTPREHGSAGLTTDRPDTAERMQENETASSVSSGFTDDNYYTLNGVAFTPDYARGYIDCVLEIDKPSVRIRRGVYTGTPEEIEHDLSIWMVTTARSDYVLGQTHYVIYGHNTDTQDLSFNRLKNVVSGDLFTLYGQTGVCVYEVTKTAFLSREKATSDYVDDFSHPSSKCFILTCADREHAGMDFLVEGTLTRTYSPAEWAQKAD